MPSKRPKKPQSKPAAKAKPALPSARPSVIDSHDEVRARDGMAWCGM